MKDRVPGPGQRVGLLGRERECALLDQLVADVRHGRSRPLVLRGEAGIGKTALLEYLIGSGSDLTVVRAAGTESEMELPYASLHQLCATILDRAQTLPPPQRVALDVVFGIGEGPAPDRFLVAVAVLSLMSAAAEGRPLLCVVDDAQWLDQSSASTLEFVARRLVAQPLGLVVAARDTGNLFQHVPELRVAGLGNDDARTLLDSTVQRRLDDRVRDRIIAEAQGNPLALLELPRDLGPTELWGFSAPPTTGVPSRLEERFRRRISALPDDTRRLLLIAAAEPLGDLALVLRAAGMQGIGVGAAAPATEAGLCEFTARVQFRHPLVRAAAYRAASRDERRTAHAAIAQATNPDSDRDHRAWHLALASAGLDDAVADELERSALRAQARGGQAATAAFLQRAARLTLDPTRRVHRTLAAAEASYLAGSAEDALRLAADAELGSLDESQHVAIDVLRGRVAMMQRRISEAPRLLLNAAQRLERHDRKAARDTYRDAFASACFAGRLASDTGLPTVSAAIRSAAISSDPPTATAGLLDAAACLVDAGYSAGGVEAQRALGAFRVEPMAPEVRLRWLWLACRLSLDLWDEEAWDELSAQALELVRDGGTLALFPQVARQRIAWDLFAGELTVASARVVEHDAVLEAIGGERLSTSRVSVAAFRGDEAELQELAATITPAAVARGQGQWIAALSWATAVLYNGLGRYDEALSAAQQGAAYPPEMGVGNWALSELVEAAVRAGRPEAADVALERLAEMADGCATDWVLGVLARARALVAGSSNAEELYRLALEHLHRTSFRAEVARAQLLYGEWARRQGRRVDARVQLRAAYDLFSSIGMKGFAERARGELLATGEQVRKRTTETRDDLTPQERHIAHLARDGLSNTEIGAQLFLSARTVEWHLHNVFIKLGISSRRELRDTTAGFETTQG